MPKKRKKSLTDTPFAIERLFVWAVGVMMVIAVIMMATLAYQGKTIPPQLQSVIMVGMGAFVARIERNNNE